MIGAVTTVWTRISGRPRFKKMADLQESPTSAWGDAIRALRQKWNDLPTGLIGNKGSPLEALAQSILLPQGAEDAADRLRQGAMPFRYTSNDSLLPTMQSAGVGPLRHSQGADLLDLIGTVPVGLAAKAPVAAKTAMMLGVPMTDSALEKAVDLLRKGNHTPNEVWQATQRAVVPTHSSRVAPSYKNPLGMREVSDEGYALKPENLLNTAEKEQLIEQMPRAKQDIASLVAPTTDIVRPGVYKLGELVEHPAWFKADPSAQDIPVSVLRNLKAYGSYTPGAEHIELGTKSFLDANKKNVRSSLLHEGLHREADQWGWPQGTSTEQATLSPDQWEKLNDYYKQEILGNPKVPLSKQWDIHNILQAKTSFDRYQAALGEKHARVGQFRLDQPEGYRESVSPTSNYPDLEGGYNTKLLDALRGKLPAKAEAFKEPGGNFLLPAELRNSTSAKPPQPVEDWINKQFKNYALKDMGTANDPVRMALGDNPEFNKLLQRIGNGREEYDPDRLQYAIDTIRDGNENVLSSPRVVNAYSKHQQFSGRDMTPWDMFTANSTNIETTGDMARQLGENAPEWMKNAPPHTPVHTLRNTSTGVVGLSDALQKHLTDALRAGDPTYPGRTHANNAVELLRNMGQGMTPKDLAQTSVPDALRKLVTGQEANVSWKNPAAPINSATNHIMDAPGGSKWVEYDINDDKLTRQGLKSEGEVMSHCIGDQCEHVIAHGERVFSMRNPKGKPEITMKMDPTYNDIEDLKRFANGPIKTTDRPHLDALLKDKIRGTPMTDKEFSEYTKPSRDISDAAWAKRPPGLLEKLEQHGKKLKESDLNWDELDWMDSHWIEHPMFGN